MKRKLAAACVAAILYAACAVGQHGPSTANRDRYYALDSQTYALLQVGRDADARQYVEFVQSSRTLNEQTAQTAYAAAAIPARFALERGAWSEAAKLALIPPSPTFAWSAFPEGEAVNAYARGLGAARAGNAEAAKLEAARLGELLLDLNRPLAALAAFEESQRAAPDRFRNVYGAARAAELAGKRDKAKTYYARLLRQVGPEAVGRPEIAQARTFVAKL